jgi:hypothetical protein
MKDEDCAESCDPSPECELEPQLDEPDKNAHFTPPINFFILHSTCNINSQQQGPSTLGVTISVSRTGGRKQGVCRDFPFILFQSSFYLFIYLFILYYVMMK